MQVLGWTQWGRERFHHAAQVSAPLKASELFISGVFHLRFSDHDRRQVTETTEREAAGAGGGTTVIVM